MSVRAYREAGVSSGLRGQSAIHIRRDGDIGLYAPVSEVRRRLNVDHEFITQLCRQKKIPFRKSNGRYFIQWDWVLDLEQEWANGIPLPEVMERLCRSRSGVQELVYRGILKRCRYPNCKYHRSLFTRQSVEDAERMDQIPRGWMTTKMASRICGWSQRRIGKLAASGAIEAVRKGRGWIVRVETLPSEPGGVRLSELARRYGIRLGTLSARVSRLKIPVIRYRHCCYVPYEYVNLIVAPERLAS